MNVQRADSQPAFPVNNTTTTTTTTTTINSEKAESSPPTVASRPKGWHASRFGFDWDKRSDQHRYRLSIGLPEVHAAVVNHDWETASELLCPDDIGLLWLPAVSQRDSKSYGVNTETGGWSSTIPSKNKATQLEAIRQMALDIGVRTEIEGTGCLYGANLLTLCVQTSAPPEFMQKLMSMIRTHAPQYLNLPDASGRTPLYVAIDQGDEALVRMLLDAGARPDALCRFAAAGLNLETLQADSSSASKRRSTTNYLFEPDDHPVPGISAYDHALVSKNRKIFCLLVENLLKTADWKEDYPITADPLKLEQWASLHTEDELRALASQLGVLKSFLFNLADKSGSSIIDRTLALKEPLDKDVIPLFNKDPELGAIFAAAVSGDTETFITRMNCFIEQPSVRMKNANTETLVKIFLMNCNPEDIYQLIAQCPALEKSINNVVLNNPKVTSLPFKTFCTLVNHMWPNLTQSQREFIAAQTGNADDRYTSFVINSPGFQMNRPSFSNSLMYQYALHSGNKTAFEFAADHDDDFNKLILDLRSGSKSMLSDIDKTRLKQTLKIQSLRWFGNFMDAGLNLQSLIDSDADLILPMMADLSPERLSHWLTGMNFDISLEMIDGVRTPEGRAALLTLIKPEKPGPPKADAEKPMLDND